MGTNKSFATATTSEHKKPVIYARCSKVRYMVHSTFLARKLAILIHRANRVTVETVAQSSSTLKGLLVGIVEQRLFEIRATAGREMRCLHLDAHLLSAHDLLSTVIAVWVVFGFEGFE
jgi:hypothetical protein